MSTKSYPFIMRFMLSCLLVVASCCWVSCQKEATMGQYSLKNSSKYTFNIDTLTSAIHAEFFHYYKNHEENIYLLNTISNTIQKYNFKTKKLVNKIILEKEGPNGVGVANAIYVQSPDSIFVLSSYFYKISLINQKGQILKSYSLLMNGVKLNNYGIAQGETALLPMGDNLNHLVQNGGFLYIGAYPVLDYNRLEFFSKGKSGIKLNILTGSVEFLINYPIIYQKLYQEGWRFPGQYTWSSQTFNTDKGLCVFSFPADEDIYVLDVKTNQTEKYPIKSQYFSDIKLHQIARPTSNQNYNHCIENHQYERIYYDRYRKIYLRFSAHPNEKYDRLSNHPPIVISIILINDKFQKIGETLLDEWLGGGYLFFRQDGIYLISPSKDEDHIAFTRFDLVKNE